MPTHSPGRTSADVSEKTKDIGTIVALRVSIGLYPWNRLGLGSGTASLHTHVQAFLSYNVMLMLHYEKAADGSLAIILQPLWGVCSTFRSKGQKSALRARRILQSIQFPRPGLTKHCFAIFPRGRTRQQNDVLPTPPVLSTKQRRDVAPLDAAN